MSFLLDASALIPLIMKAGKSAIIVSKKINLCTTELGIYEACYGFWKLTTLLKTMNLSDAAEMIDVLSELSKRNLSVIRLASINMHKTLELATQYQLTFYDASYLAASEEAQATLVTDDKKLRGAAAKTIKSATFNEFQKKIRLLEHE